MTFHVIDMPIEPIETRYSKQWTEWFAHAYCDHDFNYSQIKGSNDACAKFENIKNFLDPTATFNWKFSQLRLALITIKSLWVTGAAKGFVVFLHDAWFPGIECFKYLERMAGIPIRIVGFWHAGAYIPEDLLGQADLGYWLAGSEQSWFALCDAVCLGSEHHKQMILSTLARSAHDGDKVHVTGYPCKVPVHGGLPWSERAQRVVWPHRLSPEKNPQVFDLLAQMPEFKGVEFVKTLEVCKTKAEYYDMLASSKVAVSTAALETFGISMVEAALSGCRVCCPYKLAYKETMSASLYSSMDELVARLKLALSPNTLNGHYYNKDRYSPSVVCGKICDIIQTLGNEF